MFNLEHQVIRTLDSSVLAHVSPAWKVLLEDKEVIRSKVQTLLKEKRAEIAAVRRKVEWEMNGTVRPLCLVYIALVIFDSDYIYS